MLTQSLRARIEKATVRTLGSVGNGQGVLVPGGLILTAAHCIGWSAAGEMALGDHFIVTVETSDGRKFNVAPVAVDPISDMAALRELDSQEFPNDAKALHAFSSSVEPVVLCSSELSPFTAVPAYVHSHECEWIEGTVESFRLGTHRYVFQSSRQIKGGTSGGPIVSRIGELLGVVSSSSITDDLCTGLNPFPPLALPVWVMRLIQAD